MARDKITVDLILATKQADREVARINKNIEKLGRTMSRSFGGASGGGDKVRALGSGLSKATVKADEFSKSMEASNAPVREFSNSNLLSAGAVSQNNPQLAVGLMAMAPLAPVRVSVILWVFTSTTEIVASPALTTYNVFPSGENTAVMAFLPVAMV